MIVVWWILLGYLVALPFLLIGIGENLLALSFYINVILIGYMTWISLIKNNAGPAFAVVNVFIMLFFYVAPIYQIIEYPGYLINNYTPTSSQLLLANMIVFVFTAVYLIFYLRMNGTIYKPVLRVSDESVGRMFPVLVVLAMAAAVWAVQVMLTNSESLDEDTVSSTVNIGITIRHKVAFVIPFAALGFYLSRRNARRSWAMLALLAVLVLLSKNMLLDRRNSLGPVYLAAISLFVWRGRISSRQVFLLIGPALLFLFPIFSIFINNPSDSWGDLLNFENVTREIRGHFVDMHYDAWANLVASIQYVQTEGLQLGRQIAGALVFWLPRDMWIDKPVSSGQMLGDYLVLTSGLWFTNISFSFPAEGYVDFGMVGVIVYGAALAFYSQRLDYFANHGGVVDRTSALYFSFYLTFVMRGSFLPAFAFGVGALVALNLLPAILSRTGLKTRSTASPPRGARSADRAAIVR